MHTESTAVCVNMLPDAKTLVRNVYKVCKQEATRKRLFVKIDSPTKRACAALGISKSQLMKTLGKEAVTSKETESSSSNKHGGVTSVDSFSKGVIKRTCFEFFDKNKTLTLRNLQQYLKETHDLDVKKLFCGRLYIPLDLSTVVFSRIKRVFMNEVTL